MTNISDLMTRDILVLSPQTTVREAAIRMAREGVGTVLVGDEQQLFGILTDRDITIRAATQDRSPADYSVEDVMSRDLKFVYEHENVETAASTMAKLKMRRLAVLNDDKRLVGLISLSDIAAHSSSLAKQTLHDVSVPEVRDPAPTGSHDAAITSRPQLKEPVQDKSDDIVDAAGMQSFPASDPPSHSSSNAGSKRK